MNARRLFIILSLGLNLALAATLFAWRTKPPAPHRLPMTHPAGPSAANGQMEASSATNAAGPAIPFNWSRVESEDYHQYIANLRAIHCPERLIRDIIVADIEQLYADKAKELDALPVIFDPWAGLERRVADQHKRLAQTSTLETEKQALIKELLGVEWNAEAIQSWIREPVVGVMLGFLPDEKSPQVMQLIAASSRQVRQVEQEANYILIEEDHARLQNLRGESMAQLGQLLTPAELDELQHRAQLTFVDGGIHLDGVTLSGAEMRAMAGLSRTIKDVMQDAFGHDESDEDEAEQARRKQAFEQQFASLLGPQRFADYQRAQDGNFRDAFDFTKKENLPVTAAVKVGGAVRNANEQAAQIRKDKTLAADEEQAALTVLQAATRNAISSALGPAAFAEYEKGNGAGLKLAGPPAGTKGGAP